MVAQRVRFAPFGKARTLDMLLSSQAFAQAWTGIATGPAPKRGVATTTPTPLLLAGRKRPLEPDAAPGSVGALDIDLYHELPAEVVNSHILTEYLSIQGRRWLSATEVSELYFRAKLLLMVEKREAVRAVLKREKSLLYPCSEYGNAHLAALQRMLLSAVPVETDSGSAFVAMVLDLLSGYNPPRADEWRLWLAETFKGHGMYMAFRSADFTAEWPAFRARLYLDCPGLRADHLRLLIKERGAFPAIFEPPSTIVTAVSLAYVFSTVSAGKLLPRLIDVAKGYKDVDSCGDLESAVRHLLSRAAHDKSLDPKALVPDWSPIFIRDFSLGAIALDDENGIALIREIVSSLPAATITNCHEVTGHLMGTLFAKVHALRSVASPPESEWTVVRLLAETTAALVFQFPNAALNDRSADAFFGKLLVDKIPSAAFLDTLWSMCFSGHTEGAANAMLAAQPSAWIDQAVRWWKASSVQDFLIAMTREAFRLGNVEDAGIIGEALRGYLKHRNSLAHGEALRLVFIEPALECAKPGDTVTFFEKTLMPAARLAKQNNVHDVLCDPRFFWLPNNRPRMFLNPDANRLLWQLQADRMVSGENFAITPQQFAGLCDALPLVTLLEVIQHFEVNVDAIEDSDDEATTPRLYIFKRDEKLESIGVDDKTWALILYFTGRWDLFDHVASRTVSTATSALLSTQLDPNSINYYTYGERARWIGRGDTKYATKGPHREAIAKIVASIASANANRRLFMDANMWSHASSARLYCLMDELCGPSVAPNRRSTSLILTAAVVDMYVREEQSNVIFDTLIQQGVSAYDALLWCASRRPLEFAVPFDRSTSKVAVLVRERAAAIASMKGKD